MRMCPPPPPTWSSSSKFIEEEEIPHVASSSSSSSCVANFHMYIHDDHQPSSASAISRKKTKKKKQQLPPPHHHAAAADTRHHIDGSRQGMPQLSDYKLIKALGNGNMGTVFLGLLRHTFAPMMDSVASSHHGLFALKVMSKEEMWKKGMSKRAVMEKEVLAACTRTLNDVDLPPPPFHNDRNGMGASSARVSGVNYYDQQQQKQRGPWDSSPAIDLDLAGEAAGSPQTIISNSMDDVLVAQHAYAYEGINPFLPCLHAHFSTESYEVLVLDYCAGGDLNALRRSQPHFRFTEDHARFYAAEIVVALEELQARGYVYRDLKPENVMIKGTGHVMLVDFDLCTRIIGRQMGTDVVEERKKKESSKARWAEWAARGLRALASSGASAGSTRGRERVAPVAAAVARERGARARGRGGGVGGTRAASLVGTEEYLAPEVVWGEAGVGPAVDWWALGVLLFELLAGVTPFKGATRRDTFFNILCRDPPFHLLPTSTSTSLIDLLSKLLAKKPHLRLSSAHAVKSHPFFASHILSWSSLPSTPPPFLPPLSRFPLPPPTPDHGSPSLLLSNLAISQHQRRLAASPSHADPFYLF